MRRLCLAAVASAALIIGAGCSGDDSGDGGTTTTVSDAEPPAESFGSEEEACVADALAQAFGSDEVDALMDESGGDAPDPATFTEEQRAAVGAAAACSNPNVEADVGEPTGPEED